MSSGTTDGNGVANFRISGAPQAQKIPQRAEGYERHVTLRLVPQAEQADLSKDILSVIGDASSPITGTIQKLLTRTRLLTFRQSVAVRDWRVSASFQATLTGYQRERHADHINVIVGPPCTGGPRSSSADQELTFQTEDLAVDAHLLDNPRGNWGDQAVALLPRGMPLEAVDEIDTGGLLDGSLILFSLPASVRAERRVSSPGQPPLPERVDFESACAGDGNARPPTPDCGVRNYLANVDVAIAGPRRLFPLFSETPVGRDPNSLYQSCGGGLDMLPGQFVAYSSQSGQTGGAFPSIEEIFDPSVLKIEIMGSAIYQVERPGWLNRIQYEWTLTLCRDQSPDPAATISVDC